LDAIKDAVEFVEEEDASAASAAGTKAAPSTA